MGLRERNAAQTRELILDTALTLFLERGFEATRMEEIAERADIGTSTLYRYFPNKDLLLTEPLAIRGQMAAELAARPDDEPLDLALGHAITALIATPRLDMDRMQQLWSVLETAPGPLARLGEDFVRERVLLEQAIATRLGRPADDPFCLMTARLAVSVLELVGSRNNDDTISDNAWASQVAVDYVRDLLAQLRQDPPVLPRIE